MKTKTLNKTQNLLILSLFTFIFHRNSVVLQKRLKTKWQPTEHRIKVLDREINYAEIGNRCFDLFIDLVCDFA